MSHDFISLNGSLLQQLMQIKFKGCDFIKTSEIKLHFCFDYKACLVKVWIPIDFFFKTRISFSALNSNSLASHNVIKTPAGENKRDILFQLNCIVFVWMEGTIPMQIAVCKSM